MIKSAIKKNFSKASSLKLSDDPVESGLLSSSGYLLARIGMESRRLWTRMLAQHTLTPHQFGVIIALASCGDASQRQLSATLGIDPRNAMAVFDILEERDLIERREDPSDRRRHSVRLTQAGLRKTVELRRMGEEIEREMLKGLSVSEKHSLHELLVKLFVTMAL
jgi:DNA-binding MarR family transcriptional regulator